MWPGRLLRPRRACLELLRSGRSLELLGSGGSLGNRLETKLKLGRRRNRSASLGTLGRLSLKNKTLSLWSALGRLSLKNKLLGLSRLSLRNVKTDGLSLLSKTLGLSLLSKTLGRES